MDPQEVTVVEKELLELIIRHLRENKIELSQAEKLAADFLSELPFADKKDLLTKLKTLGAAYEEAQEVYVQEFAKESEKDRDIKLTEMRDAIARGNIEQALTVAKTQGGTDGSR